MSTLSEKCRRKVAEEGYTSLMNDTKWRELCMAFSAFKKIPAWRTRDFLNEYLSDWDTDWYHHVGPDYCSIEWLEIDPQDCSKGEILLVLQEVGVSFEDLGSYIRVIGYRK